MCGGGGGGDGGLAESQAAEAKRQAQIQASIDKINSYYDGLTDPRGAAINKEQDNIDVINSLLSSERKGTKREVQQNSQGGYSGGFGYQPSNNFSSVLGGSFGRQPVYENYVNQDRVADLVAQLSGAESAKTAAGNASYEDPTQTIYDTNFSIHNKRLQELYKDASLQDKFSAARSGQLTGSADLDRRSKRRTELGEGALTAGRLSRGAQLDYTSQLNNERSNLIAQAQGGLSGTDAIRLGAQNQQNAANQAKNSATSSNLGQVFSNIASGYTKGQENVGRNNYNGAYFNNSGTSGRIT